MFCVSHLCHVYVLEITQCVYYIIVQTLLGHITYTRGVRVYTLTPTNTQAIHQSHSQCQNDNVKFTLTKNASIEPFETACLHIDQHTRTHAHALTLNTAHAFSTASHRLPYKDNSKSFGFTQKNWERIRRTGSHLTNDRPRPLSCIFHFGQHVDDASENNMEWVGNCIYTHQIHKWMERAQEEARLFFLFLLLLLFLLHLTRTIEPAFQD